jgi:hypothetical protein
LSGELATYELQNFSANTILGLESPMADSNMFAVVPGVAKQGQWLPQADNEDLLVATAFHAATTDNVWNLRTPDIEPCRLWFCQTAVRFLRDALYRTFKLATPPF